MANPIKFGTDGWRGIIAEDFTFENVRICAQAVAEYLGKAGLNKRSLVIGYDTRFASEDFAAAATEVIAGNDIKVHLCLKPTPTPVVSFAVPSTKSAGAILITASHNPGSWNGFKYRSQDGASAPDKVTSQIEKNIASVIRGGRDVKRLTLDKALKKGIVDYVDPSPAYLEHLSHFVDLKKLRRQKLSIVIDPMYGAGIGYFEGVLKNGNLKTTEINSERNPSFPRINPEPIAKNLTKLSRVVIEQKADVGLATDGDADRIGIVDEKGQ
ncbi:MAG TPA: phosphoglucomutase/phosphomannomutase family protein, partial [Dehalococcoidia bacterium]|nr:phosphoglucomutase/phosphomannomutase family protein [Dehalococcoidia bacterium]